MKRHLLIVAMMLLSVSLMAETFTIVFNSNENGDGSEPKNPKVSDFILTATNNCVDSIIYLSKVARAKPDFGIKGGTASLKGEIAFRLDYTYHVTAMTVYAACYNNATDLKKTYGIDVCGQNIQWDEEHKTEIYPYVLNIDALLDSISIAAVQDKNNRWYVQKIEFEAEEPDTQKAILEMQYPTMNFGGVKWESPDEPMEDILSLNLVGKHIDGNITLSLQGSTTIFSLSESTLPAEGGEVDIFYSITMDTVKKAIPLNSTLIAKATGLDGIERTRELDILLTVVPPSSGGASTFDLDTTRIVIGPMPGDYYKYAQNTADSTLKNHLGYIICTGRRYRYGSGSKHSWDAFFHTDRDTVTNQVLDMYSNEVRYFDPEKPTASVKDFDIEHMLPKSWWGGDVNPAYCDIFHLVPGDYSANRSKSNHAPGIPADSTFNNGSFVTGSGKAYGLQRVFCPEDQYKGDFARAYFYIATCYGDSLTWLTTGEPGVAMTNEGWQEFQPWLRDLLLEWHRLDPVSKKELDRAIEVNKIQGNRNPFIDYPELAEYIWGNKQGEIVDFKSLTQSYGDPYSDEPTAITSPASESTARKVLKNGQMMIIRNDAEYSVIGQRTR